MARGNAVIEIDVDPFAARAARRRALMRIGVPVLAVVLTIAVILIIAIHANRANLRGALALSDEVLTALDERIGEQVGSYFAPAKRATALARDLLADEPPDQRLATFERFSIGELMETRQIAELALADSEGNFMLVRRNERSGGLDTEVIRNAPGPRRVVWIRRDREGRQTAREEGSNEDYDPRIRPWFTGALSTNTTFWSDVYTFYVGKRPGISASIRILGSNAVVGVFITVAELSRFLGELPIGKSGRAMIITRNGRLIAYPLAGHVRRRGGIGPLAARIDEIGDDAATAAYDRFRVEGPGYRTVEVGGHRYLTTVRPIAAAGHDWSILIVAPEKDFIGFVAHNNRVGLVMSLAIVALTALSALLLVRQGLRADRATRLALEQSRAVGRQSEILQHLADDPELFDPSEDHAPSALTESAVDITGARRVSLWYLLPDGQTLRCADSFQREASVHTAGFEVRRDELPRFFENLCAGGEFEVADSAADPRTTELYRLLLAPLGTRSLSLFPVRRRGRVIGAVWLEDPAELAGSRQLLRLLAGLAAWRGDEQPKEARHLNRVSATTISEEPEAVRSRSADLSLSGPEAGALSKGLYGEVSVLVLRLHDPAPTSGAPSPELVDATICAIQDVATEEGIPYLKIVGFDIVGAAGFDAGDPTAATRIANTAVAGRDRVSKLFEANGLAPELRLGIDCGMAIGREVGGTLRLFNLWGEAVDTAKTMAASAPPGMIQASEAAYLRLRHSFLFRPRGTFYLPGAGPRQSFILAGRL